MPIKRAKSKQNFFGNKKYRDLFREQSRHARKKQNEDEATQRELQNTVISIPKKKRPESWEDNFWPVIVTFLKAELISKIVHTRHLWKKTLYKAAYQRYTDGFYIKKD